MRFRGRGAKYKHYVISAINAAKLSIEMFNRVDAVHSHQASLIFNAQAWELLSKAILVKRKKNIFNPDGTTITAEKAINKLHFEQKLFALEEAQTILQVISLRHEALHSILPDIDQEIITHLLYYSLRTFYRILKCEFKSYISGFDKNFLAISFKEFTFYSHRVSKLFGSSRKFNNERNRLLYLLDRGCELITARSNSKLMPYEKWKQEIKKLPRKSRVGMHLKLYDYIKAHDDVRFIPIQISKGYKPEIQLVKTNNPLAPVFIKKTNPNQDYPHFTCDIAENVKKSISFIAKMARKLNLIHNPDYSIVMKTTRAGMGGVPKYNDKALNYIKDYLDKNPGFNPYIG